MEGEVSKSQGGCTPHGVSKTELRGGKLHAGDKEKEEDEGGKEAVGYIYRV